MDATITHGAALLFAGTFPPPDGLRARTASKLRLKSRQGAAFPRRFIRLSSALAQRSAHPCFSSRLAHRRLVDLAGSTTIDNEFTDDFKDVNGASLARCGSRKYAAVTCSSAARRIGRFLQALFSTLLEYPTIPAVYKPRAPPLHI